MIRTYNLVTHNTTFFLFFKNKKLKTVFCLPNIFPFFSIFCYGKQKTVIKNSFTKQFLKIVFLKLYFNVLLNKSLFKNLKYL